MNMPSRRSVALLLSLAQATMTVSCVDGTIRQVRDGEPAAFSAPAAEGGESYGIVEWESEMTPAGHVVLRGLDDQGEIVGSVSSESSHVSLYGEELLIDGPGRDFFATATNENTAYLLDYTLIARCSLEYYSLYLISFAALLPVGLMVYYGIGAEAGAVVTAALNLRNALQAKNFIAVPFLRPILKAAWETFLKKVRTLTPYAAAALTAVIGFAQTAFDTYMAKSKWIADNCKTVASW